MKKFILIFCLLVSGPGIAMEPTVTVPWNSFDILYRDHIEQKFLPIDEEPVPLITLEQTRYDLKISGNQAAGTISIAGNVLVGTPEPVQLFGHQVAVTEIIESQNAMLLTSDGAYELYTQEPGMFLLIFTVSIPLSDFQASPRLKFEVPVAVRNELVLDAPDNLRLVESEALHPVGNHYFFSPTSFLDLGFESVNLTQDGEDQLLVQVDTPQSVLDAVTFFVSFTEDGSVLSALSLILPPNDNNRLELDPIAGAEVWSLHVNGKPRSLYQSPENKWIVPLEPKTSSQVILAYLTRTEKLGVEGRLDFSIPETGLTARQVNLAVGLPQRMQMLAMDSDLQPANGNQWPHFDSFSGRPHYFSKPFYRGHALASSIIYQEPVNP